MEQNATPIFSAVSNSANQLFVVLRCIGFAPKAAIQITPDGVRFSVEEGRVMQGLAFLDKTLFTSYTFNPLSDGSLNSNEDDDTASSESSTYPRFLISLSALLETLQIFGINDNANASAQSAFNQPGSSASNAFTTPALLLNRTCTISYVQPGSPLCITLCEAGITTTCELTTYEVDDPSFGSTAGDLDIPLQRDAIDLKIIMRSTWLHNAITELDSTSPTVLSISASAKKAPFFALSASGGPFSESTVEFSIDKESGEQPSDGGHKILSEDGGADSRPKRSRLAPTVTETFLVSPPSKGRVQQSYRFALIRKAARAMAAASKVSIRGDRQGVLSLQFMIELGDGGTSGPGTATGPGVSMGGNVSFVDFRFVPLVADEEGVDSDNSDASEMLD